MVIGAGSAGCVLANRYLHHTVVTTIISISTTIIGIISISTTVIGMISICISTVIKISFQLIIMICLSNRLTEDPDNQVLLLEAGPKYVLVLKQNNADS